MRSRKEGPEPEKALHEDADSLADQALEAIIRSQQLRERSRKLRDKKSPESAEPPKSVNEGKKLL